MRKLLVIAGISLSILVSACGGGGGSSTTGDDVPIGGGGSGSDGATNVLGLDGTWTGVLEDEFLFLYSAEVTVEENRLTRVLLDGVNTENPGTIDPVASDIFEFLLEDGIYGGFITSPSENHLVFIDDEANFGVLQNGSPTLGAASEIDLVGTWSGPVALFFDDELYTYESQGTCDSGTCVLTIVGALRDVEGNIVDSSIIGSTSTISFEHFASLVFYFDFANSDGDQGYGGFMLSADKTFLGAYACETDALWEDCQFAAFTRQ